MNREVILTRLPVGDRRPLAWVLYENGRPVQLELEPAGGEERTGNIYVGKIEKLVRPCRRHLCGLPPGRAVICLWQRQNGL